MKRRATAALLSLGLLGCAPKRTLWVWLEPAPGAVLPLEALTVAPAGALVSRQRQPGSLGIEIERDAGAVTLAVPGACPVRVDTSVARPSPEERVELLPLFELGPRERIVGLSASFELSAVSNCREAAAASVSFRVTGGAAVSELTSAEQGRVLRAKTAGTRALGKLPEWGIVPVSAGETLRTVFEATVVSGDGAKLVQQLGVAATARASGLPNVALSHPVLVAGQKLALKTKPEGSQAKLRAVDALSELVPDVAGNYTLSDASGHEIKLKSARYDSTALDCGRSDCHRAISESSALSPMTRVLAEDLDGPRRLADPQCALPCHTTGEPGALDGGFAHVASELALTGLPARYADLPRALVRLSGVGCLACHGPGAIPEQAGRHALLQSDVCAVCHDAPPRYGHVAAFGSSRMAEADRDPRARSEAACVGCHTSWGALGMAAHRPPQDAPPSGLDCAVCHDVHAHGARSRAGLLAPALLRELALPATLPDPPPSYFGVSRVCIACHAPESELGRPAASAAAIVGGRGGLDPEGGLSSAGPHASDPRGCLSCHGSGPSELERGSGHAFRVGPDACQACHRTQPERDASLATRARALLEKLDGRAAKGDRESPLHATETGALPDTERARALFNVLLVIEDGAADVHNPAYADALLDSAERVLKGKRDKARP